MDRYNRQGLKGLLPALILLVLALACLAGCGLKVWPSPQTDQDTFSLSEVNGTRQGPCLRISARIKGAAENLKTIIVELEGTTKGQLCRTCPFQPSSCQTLDPSSAQVAREQERLIVRVCDLDPKKIYRWRLQGTNVYSGLPSVRSKVHINSTD
jgi:hypothetical protein